jgi:hypothetical protein
MQRRHLRWLSLLGLLGLLGFWYPPYAWLGLLTLFQLFDWPQRPRPGAG